ncbi:MAG: FHA domain-containing protein [Anaerolineae bacterium]
MTYIQDLLQQYNRLRQNGSSAGSALEQLRPHIETMSKTDQTDFVRQVRVIEASLKTPPAQSPAPPSYAASQAVQTPPKAPASSPPANRPLQPLNSPDKDATMKMPAQSVPGVQQPAGVRPLYMGVKTANCPRCGKPNPVDEVLCAHCGTFLQIGKSAYETSRFDDPGANDSGYFGEESTLLLMLRDTNYAFRLRPQDNRHDIVIGRSNGASMKPDIDLLEHGGDNFGVSRLHMSVRYETKDKTVCVVDMNSANGTFLNGQRLHPREVRVIRHGDELRLGRLTMRVFFQHGVTPS